MSEQHITPVLDVSITNTAELLASGPRKLYHVILNNPSNASAFFQFFDAAAAADVTLGTTTPVQSFEVHPNSGGNPGYRDFIFNNPLNFRYGIVYAATTTVSGSSAPSAACYANFGYV